MQEWFSLEVIRISQPYLPRRAGILDASTRVEESGEAVLYEQPYARYHWYGKLKVDPITGKGAFHNPQTGEFWSRRDVEKVLTDRDMKYRGAPMRGPRWCERAWIDHGDEVIESTQKKMEEVAASRDNS